MTFLICKFFNFCLSNKQNGRTKSRDCNGNNSESELPKNLAKRRQQSHFNVPSYRPTRRVNKTQLHKTFYANCGRLSSLNFERDIKNDLKNIVLNVRCQIESGDSSSTDDENLSDNNNSSVAQSKINTNQETSNGTSRLNQNDRTDSSASFPIPSTSTGITANGNIESFYFS